MEMTFFYGEKIMTFRGTCEDKKDEDLGYRYAEILLEDPNPRRETIEEVLHRQFEDIYPTKFSMDLYIDANVTFTARDWFGVLIKAPLYNFD
jgi:hypothetical protein